ncbi:MAG: hypothetical protein ACPIOQ_75610, partial [Promethearchaeia archaeon]
MHGRDRTASPSPHLRQRLQPVVYGSVLHNKMTSSLCASSAFPASSFPFLASFELQKRLPYSPAPSLPTGILDLLFAS